MLPVCLMALVTFCTSPAGEQTHSVRRLAVDECVAWTNASAATLEYLFSSQWRTTGTGAANVRDGSRWTGGGTLQSTAGSVVTAASSGLTDWPTANALRVPCGTDEGSCLIQKSELPEQAIGEIRGYRACFWKGEQQDVVDGLSHPIQDGNAAGNTNWMFQCIHGDHGSIVSGKWRHAFWINSQTPAANVHWTLTTLLDKATPYRFEWTVTRVSSTHWTPSARVYNMAGDLLFGPSDYRNDSAGGATGEGTLTFADGPELSINNSSGSYALGCWLNAGTNQSAYAPAGTVYAYQGAMVVVRGGFPGPYNAAAEASV